MTGPADLGVAEAARALAAGETSAERLVDAALARIAAVNPRLNAFWHVDRDGALAAARRSDVRRGRRSPLSELDGVPFAVKDNIDVAGMPTSNGLGTDWPATADADVVATLRGRGMIPLGKLGMHEGALGTTSDNPHRGRVENPWRVGFTPGGSSGGSAVAVAAGLCPLTLGTDTMGSIRLPAAYCGVVGFKPSREVWPTGGVVPLSTTLDHVGPLARSVEDVARVMAFEPDPVRPGALRFATVRNFAIDAIDPASAAAFENACARLRAAGADLGQVSIDGFDPEAARRAAFLVIEAEAADALAGLRARAADAFSPEFKSMLDFGAGLPAERLAGAREAVRDAGAKAVAALERVDALVALTAPVPAFPFGRPAPRAQSLFLGAANFAGAPAISLPLPVAAGDPPVGLQLMAAPGRDAALLAIARAVEAMLAADATSE